MVRRTVFKLDVLIALAAKSWKIAAMRSTLACPSADVVCLVTQERMVIEE